MDNRRAFLRRTAGLGATAFACANAPRRLQAAEHAPPIGSCKIGLVQAGKAGLQGVELDMGPPADRLPLSTPEELARVQAQSKQWGIPVHSLMMGLFNGCPLAADPRAPAWLEQAIGAARVLDAKVILLAFFDRGDLLDAGGKVKADDLDAVAARVRAVAPMAQKAGVRLGIENYLNADHNLELLKRIDHPAVGIYYDVYNTGITRGYDVPAEIQALRGRIVQFHFKNGAKFLDAGPLPWKEIARSIRDTGYDGWIVLETSSPTGDAVADARRNAEFVREVFA